jgi:SAM-dependent methyltransferase
MKPLDIRDVAIIDAFPVYKHENIVLNVGCGEGRIDRHLIALGYYVYATDIERQEGWIDSPNLKFHQSDIFDIGSFPIPSAPIVICSEVLEHLKEYKAALANLLKLTEIRLVITIPFEKSFGGAKSGHCNFWGDNNVNEFIELCKPYSTAISKIRTKLEDVQRHQYCYLIVIDRRQGKCGEN